MTKDRTKKSAVFIQHNGSEFRWCGQIWPRLLALIRPFFPVPCSFIRLFFSFLRTFHSTSMSKQVLATSPGWWMTFYPIYPILILNKKEENCTLVIEAQCTFQSVPLLVNLLLSYIHDLILGLNSTIYKLEREREKKTWST